MHSLLSRSNDDPVKALFIALLVAMLCSVVVSSTSILLKPVREANLAEQQRLVMQKMLARLPALESIIMSSGANALETRRVELATGKFIDVGDEGSNVTGMPGTESISDEQSGQVSMTDLPKEVDVAGLKQRENVVPVNLLYRDGQLELLILPVKGIGYQSTIRAYLALAQDLNTVVALTIVEQGETPGIGTKIEEPAWQAKWADKQLNDSSGSFRLNVVKGKGEGVHEVDGITGATRTGNGINNMLEFWLGDYGFGPFLDNFRQGQAES